MRKGTLHREVLLLTAVIMLLFLFPITAHAEIEQDGDAIRANITSATEVTVSIDAPDEAALDSDFTANVNISGVVDFDSCNYDVSFDASVLRLDNVTSGLIGTTTIPVDMYIEVTSGTWRVIENVSGLTGVSGSGYLAVLHFHVIGSEGDSSAISLSNGMLANNLAEEIAATWTGASVRIAATASKPINWPVLWGVTGGVVVIGVIILSQALRRRR